MAERVKDEHHLPHRIVSGARDDFESARIDSAGNAVRIDQAHRLPTELATQEVEWQELHGTDSKIHGRSERVAAMKASPLTPSPAETVDEMTRFQRFISQKSQLEQRERALALQLAAWEEERRQSQEQIDAEHTQLDLRRNQIQKNQSALAEQFLALEAQLRRLEADRQAFQKECAELDRRKQSLRTEIQVEFRSEREALERDRAVLQKDVDQLQVLKETLQSRLKTLDADNRVKLQADREQLWQTLSTEWEQRQREFAREREEWARICQLEKVEIDREKAIFEAAVNSANAEFLRDRESLAVELAELRQEHSARLAQEQTTWQTFQSEQELQLASEKAALLEMRSRTEQELSTRYAQQEHELTARRFQQEEELARNAAQHADRLREADQQWQAAHDEEQQQWELQRADLITACEQLKLELEQLREQHQQRLIEQRRLWEEEHEALRVAAQESLSAELAAQRHAWELTQRKDTEAFEAQKAEMLREVVLMEQRLRFQQAHLDKSRTEFDQTQNEFRYERQLERQRLEAAEMLLIRRVRQIELYRASIDAREKSLDREMEIVTKTRQALSNSADVERSQIDAERHAWTQERQIQQQELARQQALLNSQSEAAEGRRVRLDKLRAELEETHRSTLEMRLAVEEAWAQLSHATGQEEARVRVEQARQALLAYYQQMHQAIAAQSQEFLDAQARFERQRAEFAEERATLTGWITSRDEVLKVGEARLRATASESAANHTKWLAARDRWLIEKTEAEHLIRRLLTSLGDSHRDQSLDTQLLLTDELLAGTVIVESANADSAGSH